MLINFLLSETETDTDGAGGESDCRVWSASALAERRCLVSNAVPADGIYIIEK